MYNFAFMALVGVLLGIIGAGIEKPFSSIISAAILVGVFGAYNQLLERNNGILSGLTAGWILGFGIGAIGLLIGETIDGVLDGAIFGLSLGLVVGVVIGVITRAQPHEDDNPATRLFLVSGSIGIGALLGGAVGVVAGSILGLLGEGVVGIILAALVGGIIGSYLGSYFKSIRRIIIGAIIVASLSTISSLIGGAFAGVILGAISGSFAPMLWVAAIGAYGGLASRGVKAMVVEAIEAPSEMLTQGAVPFLMPAMVVGAIIGTAASGPGGLIALPTSLALTGLMLGVLGELDRRPNNQVTIRSLVEVTIMGTDEWPINRLVRQMTGRNRKTALVGAAIGVLIGLAGSAAGVLIGQLLVDMIIG